jgi:hypothetical protein
MRLGRVEFRVSYVVDLDNEDMVTHAMDSAFDDVVMMGKYDNLYDHINVVPAHPTDTPDDIPGFLLDEPEDGE